MSSRRDIEAEVVQPLEQAADGLDRSCLSK
jgi:hypothetical protein